MLAILLPAMFSGCFGEEEIVKISEEDAAYLQPWERSGEIYDNSDVFSRVSVNGSYAIDTVRSVYVDVPTITAADGGAGLTEMQLFILDYGCLLSKGVIGKQVT